MASINLLPQREKSQERFVTLQHRLQIAAVILLVIVTISTVVTLFFYTSLSTKRAEIVSHIQEASGRIEAQEAKEALIVVVKDKTSTAQKLLDSRIEYVNFFKKLALLIPQGIYFNDMRVFSGNVVFSGKAKTSADVAGMVTSFSSARGAEILSDLNVESLSADETGVYSFVISGKLAR